MAASSREKWNRIYQADPAPGHVAAVLVDNASLLPATGKALDIACGTGANSLFLAARGLNVEAWDISDVAVSHLCDQGIDARVVDITPASFPGRQFDVIVNCHYLDRSITRPIIDALAPGGLVFFQTFLADRVLAAGPGNPAFLLKDNELRHMMSGLEVLAGKNGSAISNPDDPIAGREYIVARKPA